MVRTTVQNCRRHVQAKEDFKTSNGQLYGHAVAGGYAVWSYGSHWPLFIWKRGEGWYENSDKRSVTTGKHRSKAHPLCDTAKRSCLEMREMLA